MDARTKNILFRIGALASVGAICLFIVCFFTFKGRNQTVYFEPQSKDTQTTFLFLGADRAASLCDVIMLASIDRLNGEVTVLQIPRDTYAAYTDRSYKKFNGAYASLGGAENTARFLGEAMGITIDHYVCMDLDTLCDMVDALGGVDIDIPCDMRYSDPEQGLYISFKKGRTHLDGELAEKFVRFRASYTEGDVGRLDAQKIFMAALLQKAAAEMSPVTALKLCETARGVETDMTVSDLLAIATEVLQIDKEKMKLLTLPGEQATATESGASYYVLSAPAVSEIMQKSFGGEGEFDANRVFLNTRYKSFERIYSEYAEYESYSIGEISQNGVHIDTRR